MAEKSVMILRKSWKRQITEGIKLPNKERIRKLGKKKVSENIGSGHHQTSGGERKNDRRVPQTNEKTSQNLALQQIPHQRNKHLDSIPCKILGTILKMDKGITQTNGQVNKKVDNDEQGFTSER